MHHLAMLNAEIERAVNGREAVEKALIKPFDVILMDMEMPEMNGWDAAKALREQGYSGRIYAMTALTSPEDHEKCLRTGCNAFYPKPATHSTYAEIVESLKEEPLTSVYHHQADLRDLIIAFVEEIPATIRTIEDTMRRSDSAGLEAALRSLKATAGGHGFDVISTSAAEAETALQLNKPMPEVQLLTQKVLHLCMLARAPERTATEAAEKDAKLKAEKDAEPKNEEKPAH